MLSAQSFETLSSASTHEGPVFIVRLDCASQGPGRFAYRGSLGRDVAGISFACENHKTPGQLHDRMPGDICHLRASVLPMFGVNPLPRTYLWQAPRNTGLAVPC